MSNNKKTTITKNSILQEQKIPKQTSSKRVSV